MIKERFTSEAFDQMVIDAATERFGPDAARQYLALWQIQRAFSLTLLAGAVVISLGVGIGRNAIAGAIGVGLFLWAGGWLVDRLIYRHRFLSSASDYLGVKLNWSHPVPLGDPYFQNWLERHPQARQPSRPLRPWPFRSALLRKSQ